MTIFKKIIDKKIPAKIIYEDDRCIAFHDIHPQAKVHALIIPKKEIPTIADATSDDLNDLGHLMVKTGEVAKLLGLAEKGYRLVINCKEHGGQEVPHLHIHILGGEKLPAMVKR